MNKEAFLKGMWDGVKAKGQELYQKGKQLLPKPKVSPPPPPTPVNYRKIKTTVRPGEATNSWSLDAFDPKYTSSWGKELYMPNVTSLPPNTEVSPNGRLVYLPARPLPPPGPNTLNISAHGAGAPGQFNFGSETWPFFLTFHDREPELSIPELAKIIGPGTNNIHNIHSIACNREGGCTPQELAKYFPNVTNVVQTRPGHVGPLLPRGVPIPDFVNDMSYSRLGKYVSSEKAPMTPPVRYLRQGTNSPWRGPRYVSPEQTYTNPTPEEGLPPDIHPVKKTLLTNLLPLLVRP